MSFAAPTARSRGLGTCRAASCGTAVRRSTSRASFRQRDALSALLNLGERPQFAELGNPHLFQRRGDRPKSGSVGDVVTMPAVAAQANDARVVQPAQVLRYRRERNAKGGCDVARGTLLRPDEAQDFKPARLGHDLQHGGHVFI